MSTRRRTTQNADTAATNAGRVFILDLGSATPTVPVLSLHNASPGFSGDFGYSVAISGTRVVVGAYGDSPGCSAERGR